MARAPRPPNIRVTAQGAFEKLPGKSKRWRNVATGETISDRKMSGVSREARGIQGSKETYTKGVQRGEFAYSEKTAKHQRHVEQGRRISRHLPEMTAKDRRFMFEARDTYLEKGKLSPEQKDKWKSVFARYPKNSLMELFGYPAAPPAAFPFVLAA
jgi:hypothetical protein